MRNTFFKGIAVFLLGAMLLGALSGLTSCSKNPVTTDPTVTDPDKTPVEAPVSVEDAQNAVEVNLSVSNDNSKKILCLSGTDITFLDSVSPEHIGVTLSSVIVSEAKNENGNLKRTLSFDKPKNTSVYDLRTENGKLYATINASDNFAGSIMVCVYKTAVKENVIVKASTLVGLGDIYSSSFTENANFFIQSEHFIGEKDPTISLVAKKDDFNGVSVADIEFSGTFAELTAVSVTPETLPNGMTSLAVKTSGKVEIDGLNRTGYVEIETGEHPQVQTQTLATITSQKGILLDVCSADMEIEEYLKFNVRLIGFKLEMSDDELLKSLHLDTYENIELYDAFLDSSGTGFTVTIYTPGLNLHNAMMVVDRSVLTLNDDGQSYSFKIDVRSPGVYVNFEKLKYDSGKWNAKVRLALSNGTWTTLTPEMISFSGAFADAAISSVVRDGNDYLVEFTYRGFSYQTSFDGKLYLRDGTVLVAWGAPASNISSTVSIDLPKNPGDEPTLTLEDLVYAMESEEAQDSLLDFISGISGAVMDVYSGKYGDLFVHLKTMLAGMDILDDRSDENKALDYLCEQISAVKTELDLIQTEIHELREELEAYSTEIIDLLQKERFNTICNMWSEFRERYISEMDSILNVYEANVRHKTIEFFRTANTGGNFTLYYDTDGKCAIPMPDDITHSVDAKPIDPQRSVTLLFKQGDFSATEKAFTEAGGYVLNDDVITAIHTDLKKILQQNAQQGVAVPGTDEEVAGLLYDAITSRIAIYTMREGDIAQRIVTAYNSFCNKISAHSGSSILSVYDEIVSFKYSFQSEAKQELEDIRAYLYATIYRFASVAGVAEKYGMAGGTTADVSTSAAVSYIRKNSGLKEVPKGSDYCYIVGRPITLRFGGVDRPVNVEVKIYNEYYTDPWGGTTTVSCIAFDKFVDSGLQFFSYKKNGETFERNFSNNELNMSNSTLVTATQISYIKARYMANYPNDKDFASYLVRHLAPDEYAYGDVSANKIITNTGVLQKFPLDGKLALECLMGSGDTHGKAFTKGKFYHPISEDTKNTKSKYYLIHDQLLCDIYDIDAAKSEKGYLVNAVAAYAEDHIYIDEFGVLSNKNRGEVYIYIPIL